MENLNDAQLRKPDLPGTDSGQAGSNSDANRGSLSASQASQGQPSPSTEDLLAQEIRDQRIASYSRFLRSPGTPAAFAQSPDYLQQAARQLDAGNQPFRPQKHHFWDFDCPPGTRL